MGSHVVTGAFGYSGQYIAERLLQAGHTVRTLTDSPHRPSPLQGRIDVRPFDFGRPDRLRDSLVGVDVLYNTYWVRFNARDFGHAEAVANTRTLFRAAKDAGVGHVVHVSITNPSDDSPLEYFRGKALLERALRESGLSWAILRPTVLFGDEDVLINNIAWILRHFPVFGVFGDGHYRVQPIHVDDLARLAVELGCDSGEVVVDAIGPETFTFRQLVRTIGLAIEKQRPIVAVPPRIAYVAALLLGRIVGDVVVTRPEIEGLMADLLHVDAPPAGTTRFTDWCRTHAATLGRQYASELARRRDRESEYSGRR